MAAIAAPAITSLRMPCMMYATCDVAEVRAANALIVGADGLGTGDGLGMAVSELAGDAAVSSTLGIGGVASSVAGLLFAVSLVARPSLAVGPAGQRLSVNLGDIGSGGAGRDAATEDGARGSSTVSDEWVGYEEARLQSEDKTAKQ